MNEQSTAIDRIKKPFKDTDQTLNSGEYLLTIIKYFHSFPFQAYLALHQAPAILRDGTWND